MSKKRVLVGPEWLYHEEMALPHQEADAASDPEILDRLSLLAAQLYFFLEARFPSPFLGFPFPRSFFRRNCSSLKSWCSSLNGGRSEN